jgi:hypothetical protein
MPFDALEVPSDEPDEAGTDGGGANRLPQLGSPPGKPAPLLASPPNEVDDQAADFAIPDGVTVAPGVDLDALDPAEVGGRTRQCVAATLAGERCRAPAIREMLVCSLHAGRLDSSAGGHARAQKLRLVAEEAETRMATARMGTRAIVAAALAEKHEEIRLAVHDLADRAADGDRQAALALLPYMTQALGTPAQAGPVTLPTEDGEVDLSTLDTASLRALLRTPASE